MTKYYRGQLRRHAAFWVKFRELPGEDRFGAFIRFFKEVKHEVEVGTCTLRDAGYALKPGFYDKYIYEPNELELTFAQDAIEDLIIEAAADPKKAKQTWEYIVSVMELYV